MFLVVVSPHLDDAVLSLGAWIARAVRNGSQVTVLTALACDPASDAPAKGWDARAGFSTEGEAARARRAEDADACAVLGATPEWLPFGSVDFVRHGSDDDVRARVLEITKRADAVLLPGSPLTHPDHEWLARLFTAPPLLHSRLGFYAEQPYTARTGGRPSLPAWLVDALHERPVFELLRPDGKDVLAKLRAIACYRSQLPLLRLESGLRLRLHRHLLGEKRAGGEAVAWLSVADSGGP